MYKQIVLEHKTHTDSYGDEYSVFTVLDFENIDKGLKRFEVNLLEHNLLMPNSIDNWQDCITWADYSEINELGNFECDINFLINYLCVNVKQQDIDYPITDLPKHKLESVISELQQIKSQQNDVEYKLQQGV